MSFRMVPKLTKIVQLQFARLRPMSFRMVPKHFNELDLVEMSLRPMSFRMVPKPRMTHIQFWNWLSIPTLIIITWPSHY